MNYIKIVSVVVIEGVFRFLGFCLLHSFCSFSLALDFRLVPRIACYSSILTSLISSLTCFLLFRFPFVGVPIASVSKHGPHRLPLLYHEVLSD